jgi:general secretion pathway protein N
MRADGTADAGANKAWAGPKTWLLAAVAGWALAIWALGLFGLGGRIEVLPDDPSLLQRLPQAAKPGAERLGPLGQYSEIGARPLFSDDRRPQPFFINPEGEGEEQNTFDFVLTSVLLTPRLTLAIVQPTGGGEPVRLKIGEAPETAPAWALASVHPRSVVFNGPEGERTLELRVFDGIGGEAPTAISTRPPAPTPPATPQAPSTPCSEPGQSRIATAGC